MFRMPPLVRTLKFYMCSDVSQTSHMRVEVRMKSGHSVWAKYRQTSEAIELQGIFSDYWGSNEHEFKVPSQHS